MRPSPHRRHIRRTKSRYSSSNIALAITNLTHQYVKGTEQKWIVSAEVGGEQFRQLSWQLPAMGLSRHTGLPAANHRPPSKCLMAHETLWAFVSILSDAVPAAVVKSRPLPFQCSQSHISVFRRDTDRPVCPRNLSRRRLSCLP